MLYLSGSFLFRIRTDSVPHPLPACNGRALFSEVWLNNVLSETRLDFGHSTDENLVTRTSSGDYPDRFAKSWGLGLARSVTLHHSQSLWTRS